MKKLLLLFIIITGAAHLRAQNINPEFDYVPGPQKHAPRAKKSHSGHMGGCALGSDWGVEVNTMAGFLMQNISGINPLANYANAVNTNISNVKFIEGYSLGIDAQVDYFFGVNREFGVGTGILYMRQYGVLAMNNFHVEYQATDFFGNTFRQVLTANGQIRESIRTSNLNIPLMFKYRTRLSDHIGFTADAGVLFNVDLDNHYTTDASFDYEAIYRYSGEEGAVRTLYDNAPVPAAGDLLITKQQYLATHSQESIQGYFNTLQNYGYNVGLGVKPHHTSGSESYNGGSLGLLLRPAVSIDLSPSVALNVGVYYLYQHFTHDASPSWRPTNQLGEYNSLLSGVTHSVNNSLGITAGVRFSLSNAEHESYHREHHIERLEEADEPQEEAEIEVKTIAPPPAASPVPEEEEKQPAVDMSTPVLFDVGRTDVPPAAYPIMEAAIKKLAENKKASLVIHGYADNTGKESTNIKLSKKRAESVKTYLRHKGVKPQLMTTVGHGSKNPAASNKTPEGRAKNRRVIMKLKAGKK